MNSTQIASSEGADKTIANSAPATRFLRTVVVRASVILVSVIIGLAIAELALRILAWPAPGLEIEGRGPIALRLPGPNGGAFPPKSSGRLRHYDYDVAWMVNAHGFRDRELYPKRRNEWRIGILGDSFAAGFGVEQSQRFTDLLQEAVAGKRPEATVWNLASPLCGTACEREILAGVGGQYDLNEVLLVFYGGNDLEDNLERITHPGKKEQYSDLTRGERARVWLRENVRLTTFLWISGIRAFANFKPPGIYSQTDLDRHWPYTATALTDLKQTMNSRRLTVLYIPAVPEWDDESWRKIRESAGASDTDRFLVKQAVKEWSQQENIAFIDSTPWLRQCGAARDCIFPTDGHLNVQGHAIIGRELAQGWGTENSDERH